MYMASVEFTAATVPEPERMSCTRRIFLVLLNPVKILPSIDRAARRSLLKWMEFRRVRYPRNLGTSYAPFAVMQSSIVVQPTRLDNAVLVWACVEIE
jgi:hypothetical protein